MTSFWEPGAAAGISWAPEPGEPDRIERSGGARSLTRTEFAAGYLARLAERSGPQVRLGTKAELRGLCNVSVGTFNEGVKLAQDRGYVVSRPGPGGGIFAAERPPMARLSNSMLALDGSARSVSEAIRIRDALDPLLVEDALLHAGPADVMDMRVHLADMADGAKRGDSLAFVRANWALHARIAKVSPSVILPSVYLGLLELIESHTLAVVTTEGASKAPDLQRRLELHMKLVDAIEDRDEALAQRLILEHKTQSGPG